MSARVSFRTIQSVAASWGLQTLGVSAVESIQSERQRLRIWQDSGFAGEMSFMQRESDLFVSPDHFLPGARSVLSFSLQYDSGHPEENCPAGYGRVARYARGKDYHKVLKRLVTRAMQELATHYSGTFTWRAFTDAVPLLERAFAKNAGLGFIGKNTMLIRPGEGSFFFLAETILDCEVVDVPPAIGRGSCGSCSRCLDRCPTNAFAGPYHLDARRCISYLTIEKRGALDEWERAALGEWLFGCDVCQEVCPFNHRVLKSEAALLCKEFKPSALFQNGCLNLETVLGMRTDQEFLDLFAGTPLMRTKRTGLLRNACCVAANTGAWQLVTVLASLVATEKVDLLRMMAVYALSRLKSSCDTASTIEIEKALRRALEDNHRGVRDAARAGLR